MEANGINWWKTPAESPDLNPIENLWHELKEFIRREVKPKTKTELVDGIELFWATVDVDKCTKYIRHLRKVVLKVTELEEMQQDINHRREQLNTNVLNNTSTALGLYL